MSATTAARERPILFSGPMIRALLDGRKTQTRRLVKPQPEERGTCGPALCGVPAWFWSSPRYDNGAGVHFFHTDEAAARRLMVRACPYGAPGDRLYVRETLKYIERETSPHVFEGSWCYAADDVAIEVPPGSEGACIAWASRKESDTCPMPRWASRLTLEIAEVRVQRVQEISEEDALGECRWKGRARDDAE